MKSEYKKSVFSDVININPRRDLKKGQISKYVSMSDILEKNKKINNFILKEYKGGSKFKNEDTLFARITPCLENRKTAFVDILDEDEIGFGSTEFIVFSAKEGTTMSQFVYYLAIYDFVREPAIKSMTGSSGRQRVDNAIFDQIEVPTPSIEEQDKIGKFLKALDDKIELNSSLNSVLEELGEARFRRWFMEFEFPDEEGRPYLSNGGPMKQTPEGPIPETWEIKNLEEVVDVIDCLHDKKPDKAKDGKILLQVFNLGQHGILNFNELYRVSESDYNNWTRKIELKKGDCIISKTGRVGAVAQIPDRFKAGIGRNLVALRPKKITPTYLLEYLLSKKGRNEIEMLALSGTILRSIHVKYIKKIKIIIPDKCLIKNYEKIARPFREKIENNIYENLVLSELRDILLPRLMSGDIRVNV